MHAIETFMLHYGYIALFLFAVLESACIPIPSEVTFGLGGALCSTAFFSGGQHHDAKHLAIGAVIAVGIVGSLVGSLIAYGVGRTLGRSAIDKFGKYLLLSHADLDKSEAWFAKRGGVTVLVGRVVPVIRTFISLPAGIAEMNPVSFSVLTTLGVSVWVSVLTVIGYNAADAYQSTVKGFSYAGYLVIAGVVAVLAVFYVHRYKAVKGTNAKHARKG
jgi:membrane protein DedA with SNARE-associated domain